MKRAWSKMSRVISAMLVLGMFASVVPAQVLAVEEEESAVVVEQQEEEQTEEQEPATKESADPAEDEQEIATSEAAQGEESSESVQVQRQLLSAANLNNEGEYTLEVVFHDTYLDITDWFKHSVKRLTLSLDEATLQSYLRMSATELANAISRRSDFESSDFYMSAYDQPAWSCDESSWQVELYGNVGRDGWKKFEGVAGDVTKEGGTPWVDLVGDGLYEIQNRGMVPVKYAYQTLFGNHSGDLESGDIFATNNAVSAAIFFVNVPEGYEIDKVYFSDNTMGNVYTLDNLPLKAKRMFRSEIEDANDQGYNYAFFYTQWAGKENRWFQVILKEKSVTPEPENEWKLTYDPNDGEGEVQEFKVKESETVYALSAEDLDFSYEGYICTGWSTAPNLEVQYKVGDAIHLSSDMTLYAQWTKRTDLEYTVNYYKDSVASENLIATDTDKGTFENPISYTAGKYLPEGYAADKVTTSGATTIGADESKNVLNVVYGRRTDLSYTVNYVEDNTGKVLAGPDTVSGQTYGTEVTVYAKDIGGYSLMSTNPQKLTIGTGSNTITFYYREIGPDQPAVVTPSESPAPVAPVTPVTPRTPTTTTTVTTPTATPAPDAGDADDGEAEEEVIEEEETPLTEEPAEEETITDEETPLAESASGWALLNLILAVVTVIGAVVLVIGYFAGYQTIWRLLSLIPAIGGVVAFFLTEDMSLPMAFVDSWTVLMVIIAVVQVVIAIMAMKDKEDDEEA